MKTGFSSFPLLLGGEQIGNEKSEIEGKNAHVIEFKKDESIKK